MSRKSDAKKARRKKRQVARDSRWIPDAVLDALVEQSDAELPPSNVAETILGVGNSDVDLDGDLAELVEAARKFDEWVTSRGWVFDSEFSAEGLASWFYEPSLTEFEDDSVEPVTRIWFGTGGDDDDFPESVSVALVGTGGAAGAVYTIGPDRLLERIEAVEAYRPGDQLPALG